jgi:Leucine-rich repeat (LRR) protein
MMKKPRLYFISINALIRVYLFIYWAITNTGMRAHRTSITLKTYPPLLPSSRLPRSDLPPAGRTFMRRSIVMVIAITIWLLAALSEAAIPNTERQALLDFYASAHGESWANRRDWNGAEGTECNWFGIECNADQSHVTTIDLANNQLSGELSQSLKLLTALENFSVRNNQLTGPIPDLTNLVNLQLVEVSQNQLSGAFPSLSGLRQLIHFAAAHNQLTGSIPSLTGLDSLQVFTAFNNRLTGFIPALTDLTALRVFIVNRNQLTGPIPTLTGLASLRTFYVHQNQLTGSLPLLPTPTALEPEGARLCPNLLNISTNADWDAATPGESWYLDCVSATTAIEIPATNHIGLIFAMMLAAGLGIQRYRFG